MFAFLKIIEDAEFQDPDFACELYNLVLIDLDSKISVKVNLLYSDAIFILLSSLFSSLIVNVSNNEGEVWCV